MNIKGICYDSRKVTKGDLFVAVRGFASDGHKFIVRAVEQGAAAVICEEQPEVSDSYIIVKNSRKALALISCAFFGHPSDKMTIVGFTGTNGKTTSTYLLKHILEQELNAKVGLIGTNGNMIGDQFIHTDRTTPESYELQELFSSMCSAGCTHVVMEVSSHALVLDRVAGIHYDTAIFTNLTQDHLDFHPTMQDYAEAKKTLFGMCTNGVFNADDEWYGCISENVLCNKFTYSTNDDGADLKASDIVLDSGSVEFNALCRGEKRAVRLAIPGMFSVYNAMGVISAALTLGVSLEQCAHALLSAHGVKGRAESVPVDGDYSVIIDYSHTPDSLKNILLTMRPVTRGRLMVLFGCGGDRDRAKRPLMGEIAEQLADFSIVTSDNPRTEDPMAIIDDILEGMAPDNSRRTVICDRIEAIHWAVDNAGPGDIIVLAGKGHEDYQEVGHVKHHMDEREIVADYLKERKNK